MNDDTGIFHFPTTRTNQIRYADTLHHFKTHGTSYHSGQSHREKYGSMYLFF